MAVRFKLSKQFKTFKVSMLTNLLKQLATDVKGLKQHCRLLLYPHRQYRDLMYYKQITHPLIKTVQLKNFRVLVFFLHWLSYILSITNLSIIYEWLFAKIIFDSHFFICITVNQISNIKNLWKKNENGHFSIDFYYYETRLCIG